jgi:ATP-dependent Zn protease
MEHLGEGPPHQQQPHPLAPLFKKVAALMALVHARSSPRVRLVARVALPFLLSAATIHWARRGRAIGASASAAARAVRGVHFSEFVQLVKSQAVRTAAVGAGGVIYATLVPDSAAAAAASVVTTQVVSLPPALLDLLLANGVAVGVARPSGGTRALQGLLIGAPIVYLGVISLVLWRMANDQLGGGAAGAGSDLAPGGGGGGGAAGPGAVSFDEIAGIPHAKAQVLEVVDCLRNPAKYAAAGARCPRGVLLIGPPGTGKTLLARAIAANSGASFLACAGSDFVEVFVGRGAARVRRTFAKARAAAPCVIFIDELDALGRARAGGGPGGGGGGASDEHEHAVIALLAELDGFSPAAGVLAVGATNRFQVLDEALVRPGARDAPLAAQRACTQTHARECVFCFDMLGLRLCTRTRHPSTVALEIGTRREQLWRGDPCRRAPLSAASPCPPRRDSCAHAARAHTPARNLPRALRRRTQAASTA